MRKIYSVFFLSLLILLSAFSANAQSYWTRSETAKSNIIADKAVERLTYPQDFKLFNLNISPLRQDLFSITGNQASQHTTIISLPNADGNLEQFSVVEASNFEPALQAQYPEIRAFSGKGITDPSASLKISISPQGIKTMIFRTDKANEFIEPYSQDHNVYSVYSAQRNKSGLPWVCSTPEADMANSLNARVSGSNFTASNTGQLKTMRLAQSCNGEYANYFGATSAAQVGLVLAGFNATLTRCNGCYEKDLALHLNLIANTTDVIYYNPATDPYTNLNAWNGQLQATLTSVIGEANYDIGHMFGASGGGGNAGCIGCVCVNGSKGSGITSPADGIPEGDNFDIDYVAHEVGHQLGGNHTFSMSSEGTGVNKEVGSGITIMGYAGITAQDVAPHSIDIYHEATIQQIQTNLATKTCPITTVITPNNATPVVAAVSNYIIPITTPFALTGSATDANAADVLTYCWEQNDNSTTTGNNSVASPTKLTGPNWLSFSPTTSPTRLMPKLSTILAGLSVTPVLPGGDAVANIEALSSVTRALNFRLTVRDNVPYSSTAPVKVGQTNFTDMVVNVSALVGPFLITSQNAAVTYTGGSTQTVSWSVNGTTGAPTNTSDVRISWSANGGNTFTTLIATTANDGTETITIPNAATTTGRIRVEAIGNIYFDINNANITVNAAVPTNDFAFGTTTTSTSACPAGTPTVTIPVTVTGTPGTIAFTATGAPAGTTVTLAPASLTGSGNIVATFNNASTLSAGTYTITVTGTAGTVSHTTTITFVITAGAAPNVGTVADQAVCAGAAAIFTVSSTTPGVSYQWQVSTTGVAGPFTNVATGGTTNTYNTGATTAAMNGYLYHVILTTQCGTVTSNNALLTVNTAAAITNNPSAQTVCSGLTATFSATATGAGLTYQWQSGPSVTGPFTNISGATGATYTTAATTPAMNGTYYRVIVTGTCGGAATSNPALLTVNTTAAITTAPTAQSACVPATATFTVAATGTGLGYQWQVSTDGGATFTNIAGATSATYTTGPVTTAMNGYLYRVLVSSTCAPGNPTTTTPVALSVNNPVSVTANPQDQRGCAGDNYTFSVTATPATGNTYQWQVSVNGGPYVNIAGATSPTYTITNALLAFNGNRYRVIVSGGTCGQVITPGALLTLGQKPVIILTAANATTLNPSVVSGLYLTVSPPNGNYIYSWTRNGVVIPNTLGTTQMPLTVDNFGTYRVTVIDAATGCSATSNTVVIDSSVSTHLFIYPNPVSTTMQVRYYSADPGTHNTMLNVYDSKGARVMTKAYTVTGTYGRMDVDMSKMTQGTYMVELRDASGKRLATSTVIKGL